MDSPPNTSSTDNDYRADLFEGIGNLKRDVASICRQLSRNKNGLQETIEKLGNMNLEERLIELRTNKLGREKRIYQQQICRDKQCIKKLEKQLEAYEKEFERIDKERERKDRLFIEHLDRVSEVFYH